MKLIGFLVGLLALGCSATVTVGNAPEEDVGTPDVSVSADAGQQTADAGMQVETDAGRRYPISARISPITPPARSLPPNATGVFAAAFEMTDEVGGGVPIRMVYFRRVGVGSASDIANVYDYAVTNGSVANTPFRYSLGRGVNAETNIVSIPQEGNTIRPYATTTHLLYIDLAPGTTGAQHAFEMTGILVEDGTTDGLLIPITAVRGNPITLNGDRAGRLDVQRGPSIDYLGMNVPNTAVVSLRMRAAYHDLDLIRFSLSNRGNADIWHDLVELELWHGNVRIPIAEWTRPLNGQIVIVPLVPIYMPANSTTDFIIRGRVTAPVGRTLRIYAEYPTDVQALDRELGTPAATCIASTITTGCDVPDQGSFDGVGHNTSDAVVMR